LNERHDGLQGVALFLLLFLLALLSLLALLLLTLLSAALTSAEEESPAAKTALLVL
jgi:hypothetical protein